MKTNIGRVMDIVETQVLIEDWDVDRRLSELDLNRAKLLEVVDVAVSAGADSTPFHPANAAGTLAYQYGTWSLVINSLENDGRSTVPILSRQYEMTAQM